VKSSHSLTVDGFMRSSATGSSSPNTSTKITESNNLLNPKLAGPKLKSAAQGVHQRAQRSQTLMRSAVKKPAKALSAAANISARPAQPKQRPANIDKARLYRAHTVGQNTKVQRFGHVPSKTTAHTINKQSASHSPEHKKLAAANQSSNSILYKPLPSMVTSASHKQLERMLDEALTRADAHKKALRRQSSSFGPWQRIKSAPRWLSISMSVFAVLLLTAFVAWQKVPQVTMRIAASKAHVNAHVPGYVPSGFSYVAPVQYSDGSVTVKFQANGNNSRAFSLTQKTSHMESKSLADSVVPANAQVQTSTVNGNTVYIFGNSNDAAWVNNGVAYTIKDAANLNSDQLLKIAGSL
jgi:hypothetical protein